MGNVVGRGLEIERAELKKDANLKERRCRAQATEVTCN